MRISRGWLLTILLLFNGKSDYDQLVAGASSIIKERDDFIKEIKTRNTHLEKSKAMVQVRINFKGSVGDAVKLHIMQVPLGASMDSVVILENLASGIAVDMGSLGNKLVMARHVLYGGSLTNELDAKRLLELSITDPKTEAEVKIQTETMVEFPELDLAVFDLPSSLSLTTLTVSSGKFAQQQSVTHLYYDRLFNWTVRSQPIIIDYPSLELRYVLKETQFKNSLQDVVAMNGRIVPGDSGTALLIDEDGTTKLFAIPILGEVLTGGGVAVKASALRDKLAELASQRSHE